jgi:hypothetical protein
MTATSESLSPQGVVGKEIAVKKCIHAKANWQFKTADARVKLKRLCPQFG